MDKYHWSKKFKTGDEMFIYSRYFTDADTSEQGFDSSSPTGEIWYCNGDPLDAYDEDHPELQYWAVITDGVDGECFEGAEEGDHGFKSEKEAKAWIENEIKKYTKIATKIVESYLSKMKTSID